MIIVQGEVLPIPFLMVDATDDETAETGLSPTVQFSKNGGSFATSTNSASEVGNGWYSIIPTTTETNTLGTLVMRATGSGANEWRDIHQVVEHFPADVIEVKGAGVTSVSDFKATGFSTHSAGDTADAVFDEQKADHDISGTFGEEIQLHALSSEILSYPSAASIANAVLDEVLAGHLGVGSVGEAINIAKESVDLDAISEAIWEYARRVLTVAVTSALDTSETDVINIVRGDSLSADITGLGDISDRTKLWVTIKENVSDDDNDSIIQWEWSTGLVRLNGAAGTPGNGAIIINDAVNGDITVTLVKEDTAELAPSADLIYDVQKFDGTNIVTLTTLPRSAVVFADITRAVV